MRGVIMSTTLRPSPVRDELVRFRSNSDGAQFDALPRSFGPTRAAKRQKIVRAVATLTEAVDTLSRVGRDSEIDRLLCKLDEARRAGPSIDATPDILAAIERADSADECPRLMWAMNPTLDNAKAALRAADAAIDALHAFRRAVRGTHKELA